MIFIQKKTTELTIEEIDQFCCLYQKVFQKNDKTVESFQEQYLNTALGYSFHSLMFHDGKLVGAHNEIPIDYLVNGEKKKFCVGTDLMIREDFRNFFNLSKLVKMNEKSINAAGIHFLFGFPNDNSYHIFNKAFNYKNISDLKTYILPYRIGGIIPRLRLLNLFSILLCRLVLQLSNFNAQKKQYFTIDKNRLEHDKYRWKWMGGDYQICKIAELTFVYKIMTKDNVRTAFLIDLSHLNSAYFAKAIRYIVKHDKSKIDLIMYVGYLNFNAFPLFLIPAKFSPKKFHFHGKFLNENEMDECLFDIRNWNVNLSCYDLV